MGSRKSKVNCPRTELSEKQIVEICRQTNLSDAAVRCRHAAFLEQCPDGLITFEQLSESLDEVWPEGQVERFASHLFAISDQDGDGIIDFVEFIKLTSKLDSIDSIEENNDERIFLGLIFDMFDRNHNGYLEKHELKPFIESIYDLAGLQGKKRRGIYSPSAQVKYVLKKLDKNGDKRLSKQEFLNQENWIDDERLGRFFFSYGQTNN